MTVQGDCECEECAASNWPRVADGVELKAEDAAVQGNLDRARQRQREMDAYKAGYADSKAISEAHFKEAESMRNIELRATIETTRMNNRELRGESERAAETRSRILAENERLRRLYEEAQSTDSSLAFQAEIERLGTLLKAAKAEHGQLLEQLDSGRAELSRLRVIRDGNVQEIERLRADLRDEQEGALSLETKLTNLRAAAERWMRERDDVEGWMRAAIEASR
jgi:chromosome segregation ATPase